MLVKVCSKPGHCSICDFVATVNDVKESHIKCIVISIPCMGRKSLGSF